MTNDSDKNLVQDFLNNQPTATAPAMNTKTHYKFDGTDGQGYIQMVSESKPQPEQYIKILEEVGLDSEEFRITKVKNFSGWQQVAGGTFLHAYRLDIEPISSVDNLDIDDLLAAAQKLTKPKKTKKRAAKKKFKSPETRVLHIGDLQIGKIENGEKGISDLLERYMKTLYDFAETIEEGQPVLVAHVGDCMEGNQSQHGRNMGYQTPLTMTEQTRVYRRLLLKTAEVLAPKTHDLTIGVVNGNHDESDRRLSTKSGDGWATECAIAVSDALDMIPGYDNVKVLVPPETQGHFTVKINTTTFTLMHGHQFPRPGGIQGAEKWVKDAAYYQQPASASDFILFGHFHTFQMAEQGPRNLICCSTYDGGSDWFADMKGGAWQRPFGLAFTTEGPRWKDFSSI